MSNLNTAQHVCPALALPSRCEALALPINMVGPCNCPASVSRHSSGSRCPALPVRTLHQLGALVVTAGERHPVLPLGELVLAALPQQVADATVALQLDEGCAGLAGRSVAGQGAGVRAGRRPRHLALHLTLLTVDPGHAVSRGLADLVAVPLAGVVATGQAAAALPAAGPWPGGVAGPGGGVVLAQAGHVHRVGAGRAGQALNHRHGAALLPGPHWPGGLLHLDVDVIVAGGLAGVAAALLQAAGGLAAGAGAGVAGVRGPAWTLYNCL